MRPTTTQPPVGRWLLEGVIQFLQMSVWGAGRFALLPAWKGERLRGKDGIDHTTTTRWILSTVALTLTRDRGEIEASLYQGIRCITLSLYKSLYKSLYNKGWWV